VISVHGRRGTTIVGNSGEVFAEVGTRRSSALPSPVALPDARAALKSALEDILQFSKRHRMYTQPFAAGLRALASRDRRIRHAGLFSPPIDTKTLFPGTRYPIECHQLLSAACVASVSGGMGGWADMELPTRKAWIQSGRLSEKLYDRRIASVRAAVNFLAYG
jgi:hypothetical protein